MGSQTELPYSRTGRTRPLYADSLTSYGQVDNIMSKKANGPLSLCAHIADMHVPFQIGSNCYAKIFDIFYIIKDSFLLIIGRIDHFDPFPCNLHDIAFDWLESHAPFPCPTAKAIYILLKFYSVLCTFDFAITNTVISKQPYLRVNICCDIVNNIMRTIMAQGRCPEGHLTKRGPNLI